MSSRGTEEVLLYGGGGDYSIGVAHLSSGLRDVMLAAHTDQVNTLFARPGVVVSGSADRSVKLWNVLSGKLSLQKLSFRANQLR